MIIGWICIGTGAGVLLSAFWWWEAGYRTGYHDGVNDTNAMLGGFEEVGDVQGR